MGSSYRFRVLTHIVQRHHYLPGRSISYYKSFHGGALHTAEREGIGSGPFYFRAASGSGHFVCAGGVIFSVTFMILEEPGIRYLGRISDAVQSISQGNLNTEVDVTGDDEFSAMAANLNKMSSDIRKLMDKERSGTHEK